MLVEITDNEAVAEIQRRAAQTGESVAQVVVEAVRRVPTRGEGGRPHSMEEMKAAIRDLQEWYAAHRDPSDNRTPDEIVGYNEQGLFD